MKHRFRSPALLVVAVCGALGGSLPAAAEVTLVVGEVPEGVTFRLDAEPASPANQLRLQVVADGVTDLYGVSFQLRYPHRLLKFLEDETAEGSLLSEDGAVSTTLMVRRRAPRRIIVGLARLGDAGGVDGSGTLLTLVFRGREGLRGRGELLFEETDAVDSAGALIGGAVWQDATVAVTNAPPAGGF